MLELVRVGVALRIVLGVVVVLGPTVNVVAEGVAVAPWFPPSLEAGGVITTEMPFEAQSFSLRSYISERRVRPCVSNRSMKWKVEGGKPTLLIRLPASRRHTRREISNKYIVSTDALVVS